MSAALYTPGPIEHYVKFRTGVTRYLGTAVTAPEIEVRPAYINVQNDLGGRSVPFQKVADRKQHVISTTLNRFDWATYKAMLPDGVTSAGAFGADDNTTHGVLSLGYTDFELILRYAYGGTSVIPSDFPVGRRYWSAVVLGSRESTVGTRVEEVALVIECNELFNPTLRTFRLYSEISADVLPGLPALE